MDFKIVDVFEYLEKVCVIIQVDAPTLGRWHNGYVSVLKENRKRGCGDFNVIGSEEITYAGDLKHFKHKNKLIKKAKWFFGFDVGHAWDFDHPEVQTFNIVVKRTIELAEETDRKGI